MTLGQFQDDAFQGHEHTQHRNNGDTSSGSNTYKAVGEYDAPTTGIRNKTNYGNARYDTTTHDKSIGCNYIIKY